MMVVLGGAVAAVLLTPALAFAHPLGNFTVNTYAGLRVGADRVDVDFVVDMAEIPTLQRVPIRIDALSITAGGRPVHLRVVRTALAHPRGAAGLRTTRFQAILAGPRIDGAMRTIVSPRIATSARYQGLPVPSTTRPFRRTRS